MILTDFATIILYGQLLLANPASVPVGLLWTDADVAQGFARDPAVVAFGVPDHDRTCLVHLETGPPAAVASDALWAIAAPFRATAPRLEVGTILLKHTIAIAPGRYQIVFQPRPGTPDHAYRLEIRLTPSDAPTFAILKRGSLDSDVVLRTQADLVRPSSR